MGIGGERVSAVLEAVAAAAPTPGGGAVAALCGALSVALARMVSNLAIGKEGYEGVQEDLRRLEARGRALQGRLVALADEDAKAYEAVIAARRMPKGSERERTARVEEMQAAYQRATEVPLETMAACAEALGLALEAARKGSRGAVTDAGVAALTAEAGLRGAGLNVRINLMSLKDAKIRAGLEERLEALLVEADRVGQEVLALVEGRIAG